MTTNDMTTAQDKWPLIEYIQSLLEGKGADQKIESLKDIFSDYEPLFDGRKETHDVSYKHSVTSKLVIIVTNLVIHS